MEIVDNSPEADINSPEFQALIQGKEAESTDVKPNAEGSSPAAKAEKPDEKPDEPADLEAQVKGLKAELARRSGNADKVDELEKQLQYALGRLDEVSKSATKETDPFISAVKEADEKTLISKQADWEDELADARARLVRAEENNDEAAVEKATNRLRRAKYSLSTIRGELVDRADTNSKNRATLESEAGKIKEELEMMYTAVEEKYPDFQNPESELWKAGNDEFLKHGTILRKLGPAGEIVAAAMAIIKQGKGEENALDVRKNTIRKIESGLNKAFRAGSGSPTTNKTVNVEQVSSADGLANFNAFIDKIKGG